MPKGFTQDMLQYICDLANAAMDNNREAARMAGDRLYDTLSIDQKKAESQGVPADFYRTAQGVEIRRALETGFPTKNLGLQYAVEQAIANGNPGEALDYIGNEPNHLQRAALLDAIGRTDLAEVAARKGIGELLASMPGQYQVGGKTSITLRKLVS